MVAPLFPDEKLRGLIVAEARSWIGTPYRHQASVKGAGCDCLGLVRGVWRALYGKEPETLPPYSADWAETGGRETLLEAGRRWLIERPVEEVNSGDTFAGNILVFRWKDGMPAKHAGIVSAGGQIIHSYDRVGVVETPLVSAWKRRIAAVFSFPGGASWQP